MDICALKTAIVDCCNSDGFAPEKIQEILNEYRLDKYKTDFIVLCSFAAMSCGVTVTKMLSKCRFVKPVLARRLVFTYYKSKGDTYQEIGGRFSQDRITIMHGINVMKNDLEHNHAITILAVEKFNKLIQKHENNTIKTNGFNS